MTKRDLHQQRIKRELKAAGVGRLGFFKFAIRYLHHIIHPDEHVKGVAYGRYRETIGSPSWEEGLLVATDSRVIFVDRKPGYLKSDEVSYDVISGVRCFNAWPFNSITLYTKIGNFSISFVRSACARRFVRYVEQRRLESPELL